ncbi:class I adenylate-forming enzyme family protein [Streptomyces noursei]|uniref:class I adenylate-forming enzyme family protein n=1 Tax=Streptomyces noursei TaxID=1971 RepID=UPI001679F34B|nr:class I adenylate-forming enzyme family protein [Streptomyces noursei]MCZ1018714.1 class I adenylate-forming enzyme family protein [Streptomyces noursei]GGX26786.1 AMP-binding protein [Streptomyces noursei]
MREDMGGEPQWWGSELLERHRDETVWAEAGHEVTYRRLRAQVAALRRLFQAHGIRPGATAALQGAQSFTHLWSLFALWSLGSQVMLMGPGIRGQELGRLLDHCRPQFYVSFSATGPGRRSFHDECEIYVRRLRRGHRGKTEHCLIHFTSGSTGFAKAVARTPRSLLAELDTFRRIGGMPGPGSRVLQLGPVAHSFNLVGGLLHHMDVGAVSVFPPRTSRSAILRTALRSGVGTVMGTPDHFTALALGDRSIRLPLLRRAISGGDQLDGRVHARFAERFGVRIGQAYGTTETGIVAADPTGWFAPDAVGLVAPGVRTRIVDGELQVRMAATPYPVHEARPDRFLPDGPADGPGWLRTGDRAELDASSGALRILDRIDPLADRQLLTRGTDHLLLSDRTLTRALGRSGAPCP